MSNLEDGVCEVAALCSALEQYRQQHSQYEEVELHDRTIDIWLRLKDRIDNLDTHLQVDDYERFEKAATRLAVLGVRCANLDHALQTSVFTQQARLEPRQLRPQNERYRFEDLDTDDPEVLAALDPQFIYLRMIQSLQQAAGTPQSSSDSYWFEREIARRYYGIVYAIYSSDPDFDIGDDGDSEPEPPSDGPLPPDGGVHAPIGPKYPPRTDVWQNPLPADGPRNDH